MMVEGGASADAAASGAEQARAGLGAPAAPRGEPRAPAEGAGDTGGGAASDDAMELEDGGT